jgi:hypothetical protein
MRHRFLAALSLALALAACGKGDPNASQPCTDKCAMVGGSWNWSSGTNGTCGQWALTPFSQDIELKQTGATLELALGSLTAIGKLTNAGRTTMDGENDVNDGSGNVAHVKIEIDGDFASDTKSFTGTAQWTITPPTSNGCTLSGSWDGTRL